MSKVKIYTDGSCSPNPGPGGWGFISFNDNYIWYVNGYEENTTNNRMELQAVVEAIKFNSFAEKLTIYSDSQLTINCAMGIFARKKNQDLWKEYDIQTKNKIIEWIKVKAHNGDFYNEQVDQLAKKAIKIK